MKKKLVILMSLVMAISALSVGCGKKEEVYPSRDINLVVPWNPGGSTDLTARAMADSMSKPLGTNIVVTNTPGSGGSVGALTVENADKDGYNILANGMLAMTTMPVLGFTESTYRDWDFYLATFTSNVIAVRKDSPYQTIEDLLEDMKARPGEVTDGTGGQTSAGRIAAEVLCASAGVEYKHVAYEGGGKAITGAMAGEVDFTSQLYAEMKDYFESGDMRALATFTADDITLPDGTVIPSITKAVPEIADKLPLGETTGYAIPKGQPDAVYAALDKAFDEAMKSDSFVSFCDTKGFEICALGREAAASYVDGVASTACWALYDCGAAEKSPEDFDIAR